jgi:hypothetical protein
MTTYSICKASGESLGTFEADSAAGARDAWARSWGYQRAGMPISAEDTGSLIITAVGLPAASACPFNLPLSVGTACGRVPDQIFDARDQAVLILYSVDSKGSVEEARTMKWNQNGLARADYVVKAVNEHEGLVKLVEAQRQGLHQMAEHNLEFVQVNRKLVERVKQMKSAIGYLLSTSAPITAQQKECWPVLRNAQCGQTLVNTETLIAKPVDRRKD